MLHKLKYWGPTLLGLGLCMIPDMAHANLVDSFNLAPFVPLVLDTMMALATGGYEFFVGNNANGIIYALIWGFLAFSVCLYLIKLYFPKMWLSLFGFSGGGEMIDGKATGMQISMNLLKPMIRAVVAAVLLLQLKPVYLTEWLINPFLEFGAIYTDGIFRAAGAGSMENSKMTCPPEIVEKAWISERGCNFLVQPVDIISKKNNNIISRGFDYLFRGIRGLFVPVPRGGQDFMNVLTGIILIITFTASNVFMALLIIQAIFDFGMQLTLYPFQVLMWVAKPKNPDKWFDILPPFSGIIKALQSLVITMIACAFMLCINIAVINALFHWGTTVFDAAAGGTATSNVPSATNGFGEHSMVWMSSILTFYLMLRIFELTKKRLTEYTSTSTALYQQVTSDAKTTWNMAKSAPKKLKNAKEVAVNTYNTTAAVGRGIARGGRATWRGMKRLGSTIRGWF